MSNVDFSCCAGGSVPPPNFHHDSVPAYLSPSRGAKVLVLVGDLLMAGEWGTTHGVPAILLAEEDVAELVRVRNEAAGLRTITTLYPISEELRQDNDRMSTALVAIDNEADLMAWSRSRTVRKWGKRIRAIVNGYAVAMPAGVTKLAAAVRRNGKAGS